MNIYSILQLCGGLAFFLFGMHVMSGSLEKLAGGNLQKILKEVTSNPIKSLFFGAIVTIAIQSSSALTVMLVGLVNSGIMELAQTVGVIMGSNIGTTLTAWILSLSGIESDNLFISMLKPENFSPVIALIGVIMIMGSKKEKRKDVGIIMAGFAVLMYGMQLMSGAVSPLADMPEFTGLLTTFNNPFLGVLVGAVFTGVIQSSAASVGVLHPHHHGSEHRYMRDCTAFVNRRKQKRQESIHHPHQLQSVWYSNWTCSILYRTLCC